MSKVTKRPDQALRPDDPHQSSLFIDKAREIGADEEHSEADSLIGQLAKKPPEPRIKRKKR
jgi:hypothetical protein